jgi:hypothetical protein
MKWPFAFSQTKALELQDGSTITSPISSGELIGKKAKSYP